MFEVKNEDNDYLPLTYNESKIVLLARDPYNLFAYWDIPKEKMQTFMNELGSDLWNRSVPVLKVTNISNNSSFLIRINEFSSNWYISIDDPDSLYIAEFGRKVSENLFINIASSNYVMAPNDKQSSNASLHFVNYKNLKKDVLDIDSKQITEEYSKKLYSRYISGISSYEMQNTTNYKSFAGISSAEFSR